MNVVHGSLWALGNCQWSGETCFAGTAILKYGYLLQILMRGLKSKINLD